MKNVVDRCPSRLADGRFWDAFSVELGWAGTALARHWHAYLFYVRSNRSSEPHNCPRIYPMQVGTGTALGRFRRRLVDVYMGLPGTAVVADMPVGAPPPF